VGPTLLAGLITQDSERRGDHQGLELRASNVTSSVTSQPATAAIAPPVDPGQRRVSGARGVHGERSSSISARNPTCAPAAAARPRIVAVLPTGPHYSALQSCSNASRRASRK
jgi:hypothetical protein